MSTKDTTQNDNPEYKEYLENRKSFPVNSEYEFFPDEEVYNFKNFVQYFEELVAKFTEYEIAKENKHEVDGCFQYRFDNSEVTIIISYNLFETFSEYKLRKVKEQTTAEKNKALNEKLKITKERNRQARLLELRKELEKLEKGQK
jgi:hypothetical protein